MNTEIVNHEVVVHRQPVVRYCGLDLERTRVVQYYGAQEATVYSGVRTLRVERRDHDLDAIIAGILPGNPTCELQFCFEYKVVAVLQDGTTLTVARETKQVLACYVNPTVYTTEELLTNELLLDRTSQGVLNNARQEGRTSWLLRAGTPLHILNLILFDESDPTVTIRHTA